LGTDIQFSAMRLTYPRYLQDRHIRLALSTLEG
jgi:hypothetical protein